MREYLQQGKHSKCLLCEKVENNLAERAAYFHICDNINNLKSEEATLNNGVAGLKSKKERVRKRQFRTASPES